VTEEQFLSHFEFPSPESDSTNYRCSVSFLSCSNISVHQRVQRSRCPSASNEGMWGIGVIDEEKSSASRPGRFILRGKGSLVDPTGRLDTSKNRNIPFSCHDSKKIPLSYWQGCNH